MDREPVIALGARLIKSNHVTTLGFKPNFNDYSLSERRIILASDRIYFPTAFYAELFHTMGKKTFPSHQTYLFAMDKLKQTALFKLLNIPHPETRVFYGKKQQQSILDLFSFPFIAKQPRGSSKGLGIHLIQTKDELAAYLLNPYPAYIQEYLPLERDMRIIVIGKKVRLAFWRQAKHGEFRTNISQGGKILFDPVPEKALNLALRVSQQCGWNDVGIDIIKHKGRFYVLEANMKYGTKGFKAAGTDYKKLLEKLIIKKEI